MSDIENTLSSSQAGTAAASKEVPQISIRGADISDAMTVARFVHALVDELSGGETATIEEVFEITSRVVSDAGVIALIAYEDRQPVGAMTLNECKEIYAGGKFGETSELYVDPNHRSHGIAKQLLGSAQSEAKPRSSNVICF
ncbi:GNAT family N-acetyltransferase [Litoreibacter halocynthiae]|uniref:GNAT family N-acetyltransferase n=1 Tax=Litoreibacter halocynthiae TaxID=1242689 RepID=UPI0010642773|nr:GNAT family N-acetyltransferase [Litoreibacter halocynthiae]